MINEEETADLTSSSPGESPDTICSETEFQPILAEQIDLLVHLAEAVERNPKSRMSRRIHAAVNEEASDIEDLLEDHDARYNGTFAGLLEIVAALKIFSRVGYALKIIQVRSTKQGILGSKEQAVELTRETESTLALIETYVRSLLACLRDEVAAVCPLPQAGREAGKATFTQDALLQKKLPHTLGVEKSEDVGSQIAGEATLFVAALKNFEERFRMRRVEDPAELKQLYEEVCDEQQARFLEAKLQNIQSRYDAFIRNTTTEQDDADLPAFRYIVGLALQFSRIVTHLIQLLDRYRKDPTRAEVAKAKVTAIVSNEAVIERVFNYALYFAHRFMVVGKPIARRLIDKFTTTETVELDLPDGCILHARPASMIAKIVVHHGTPVDMTIGTESCYAGSIMKVILLAGNNLKERRVTFRGDRKPIRDIELLFAHRLGEEGLESLPKELGYLKK